MCMHRMCAYLPYDNSQTATDKRRLDSALIRPHVQLAWCQAGFGPHGLAWCTSWVQQPEANQSFRAWLKKARLSAHPMPQGHLGLYSFRLKTPEVVFRRPTPLHLTHPGPSKSSSVTQKCTIRWPQWPSSGNEVKTSLLLYLKVH